MPMSRPPLPPFTKDSAKEKIRLAEDGWNSRDPAQVALAYTPDSQWRNRAERFAGREATRVRLPRPSARAGDQKPPPEPRAGKEDV